MGCCRSQILINGGVMICWWSAVFYSPHGSEELRTRNRKTWTRHVNIKLISILCEHRNTGATLIIFMAQRGLQLQFGLLAFQSCDIRLGVIREAGHLQNTNHCSVNQKNIKNIETSGLLQIRRKKQERWCNIGFSENGVYPQSWKIGKIGKRMIHRWIYDIPICSTDRLTSTQVLRQSAFFDQPGNLHAQWDRPWVIVPGDAKNIVLASVFFMFGGWWGNVKNEWMTIIVIMKSWVLMGKWYHQLMSLISFWCSGQRWRDVA